MKFGEQLCNVHFFRFDQGFLKVF